MENSDKEKIMIEAVKNALEAMKTIIQLIETEINEMQKDNNGNNY